jgi:exopolysaccharide production protein ExoZ
MQRVVHIRLLRERSDRSMKVCRQQRDNDCRGFIRQAVATSSGRFTQRTPTENVAVAGSSTVCFVDAGDGSSTPRRFYAAPELEKRSRPGGRRMRRDGSALSATCASARLASDGGHIKNQLFEGVQAFRFVAALLVVTTHTTAYASARLDPSFTIWHPGQVGVDIFFIISGFVMMTSAGSLIGAKGGWKLFGIRRLIRIVPMYWLATTLKLLLMIILPGAALHAVLNPGSTILSYVFIPSVNVDGKVEPLLGVGWTLVFEMMFYLVFTIALLIRANVLYFCTAVMVLVSVASVLRPSEDWPPAMFYLNPIVMYFVVGMVLGKWTVDRDLRSAIFWLLGVVALWSGIAVLQSVVEGVPIYEPSLIRKIGITALLTAVIALEPLLHGRIPRWVIRLGDASYSLYLFHPLMAPLVPVVLLAVGIRNGWASVVISIIGVVIASVLIYRFVEMPITRLLQRRFTPRSPRLSRPIETARIL